MMDHMTSKSSYGTYEPSVTVVCKPSSLEQGKLKPSPHGTQYGKMPKLILELYKKSKIQETK